MVDTAAPVTKGRYWMLILFALGLADVVSAFETVMVMSGIKAIMLDFGNPTLAGWMITSYLLVGAIAAAIGGRLADLIGRQTVLLASLVLAAVGSILSYSAADPMIILVGRGLQGAASAILPISMGMVREYCPPARVPLCLGILLSASGVASTIGAVIGAVIVDSIGWRHIFAFSGAVSIVALIFAWAVIPKSAKKEGPIPLDVTGALLFPPVLIAFLIGIDMISKDNPWPSMALILGGLGLAMVWVRHELRHDNPLIDIRLLMRREIAIPNICAVIWAAGSLQFTQIQMLFLQQPAWTGVGLGLTATLAASIKLPAKLVSMFVSPAAGHMVPRIGSRLIVMIGFVITGLGWAAMMTMPNNLWIITVIMTFGCSLGVSVIYVGLSTAVVLGSPAERTSEAAGVLAVSRTVGMAVGVQIVMLVLTTWPAHVVGKTEVYPSSTGYQIVFFYIAALCAIGVAVAATLPGRRHAAADLQAKPALS